MSHCAQANAGRQEDHAKAAPQLKFGYQMSLQRAPARHVRPSAGYEARQTLALGRAGNEKMKPMANRGGAGPGSAAASGDIDCDVHPAVPGMAVLFPYLDDYWREIVSVRALDRLNLSLTSYPQNAPINCRPDWKPAHGPPRQQPCTRARACARSCRTRRSARPCAD